MRDARINLENLKLNFEQYFLENGHYPSVAEIDECAYLPSSRQIQRIFKGGVQELRKLLGIQITDFRIGAQRSSLAKKIGRRGVEHEIIVQKALLSRFGEIFVHEQKPFHDYSGRFDFVVYTAKSKFGVDVFYASDKRSFTGCLNNKINIYRNTPFPVYLVQTNEELFNGFNLDIFLENKTNILPPHVTIIKFSEMLNIINSMEPISLNKATH
jgi:hypothetical protein